MKSIKEQPGDNEGILTRVWGPAGWMFLHSIAQNYPWRPTDEQMQNYYTFFKLTGNVLPCRYCRESYQEYINSGNTTLTMKNMKNRKTLFLWLYNIHNRINKKLGIKSHPSKLEVWRKYESFRANCHKSVKKPVKKGCTVPMTGRRKKCVMKIVEIDELGNEFGKKQNKPFPPPPPPPPVGTEAKIINAMKILGVTNRNDTSDIKKKYRTLSLIYHPDRPSGDEEKFKEISNAYELIMKLNGMRFGKRTKGKKNVKLVSIKKSNKSGKKLMATFETNGRNKVIHFGSAGMGDLTKHKNFQRRDRFIFRHHKDLKTGDPTRAGFLSMFILWNKPSLQASISDYRRRLGVYNRTGKFPTNIAGYKSPGKSKKYQ